MVNNELKIELNINNIDLNIDYILLESIAQGIADKPKNKHIFEQFVQLNNWKVKDAISHKNNLTMKTIKLLLKEDRHGIHTNLLRNKCIRKRLKYKAIKSIINLNNPIHSELLAKYINDFTLITKNRIIKLLVKQNEPSVNDILLDSVNIQLSERILKLLSQYDDITIAYKARQILNIKVDKE